MLFIFERKDISVSITTKYTNISVIIERFFLPLIIHKLVTHNAVLTW